MGERMEIRKVSVAGGGVLGSQIALQTAYCGYDVTVYEIEAGVERATELLDYYHDAYASRLNRLRTERNGHWRGLTPKKELTEEEVDELIANLDAGRENIRVTTIPEEAFCDADLVIEAVSERVGIKAALYGLACPLMREDAILATNTSSLLPSALAPYTARPERFLALHFSNCLWTCNTAEVMPHPEGDGFDATLPEIADQVADFAASINMEPIRLNKEQPRYVLNSLLITFLDAACDLYERGVADFRTIDKTWICGNGANTGPFQSIDIIGLPTYFNILDADPRSEIPDTPQYNAKKLIGGMIAEGRLGMNVGIGFYEYNK